MLKIQDFKTVAGLIEEKEKIEIRLEYGISKNSLFFRSDGETELYLKEGYNGKLIISRITLQNKRQGTGSKLLSLLKQYCLEHNSNKIEVESIVTYEMVQFCKKHGFKPIDGMVFRKNDGELYGNYELVLNKEEKE